MADQGAPVVNARIQPEDLPIVKLVSLSAVNLKHLLPLLVTHIVLLNCQVVLDPSLVQEFSIFVHLAQNRSDLISVAEETEHDLHTVRAGQLRGRLNEVS